jgi:Ca2+/Na+ antiporter
LRELIGNALFGFTQQRRQNPMHISVERRSNQSALGREEGFLHYVAREGRVMLRWLIGVCIVAIVLCMVSPGFFFVAVAPALLLLIAYVALLVTNIVERRSDVQAHDYLERSETALAEDVIENHQDDHQLEPTDAELVKRESRTGIMIVISVLAAALLIAAILFDLKMFAIGALVIFAYMLFIAAPLWAGWFNDDIEITSKRMIDEPESARARTGEL